MLYTRRSFTVPATATNAAFCAEKGHGMKDSRGRCLNCGEKIGPSMLETVETFKNQRFAFVGTDGDRYRDGYARTFGPRPSRP
jgi:hypothetical protein